METTNPHIKNLYQCSQNKLNIPQEKTKRILTALKMQVKRQWSCLFFNYLNFNLFKRILNYLKEEQTNRALPMLNSIASKSIFQTWCWDKDFQTSIRWNNHWQTWTTRNVRECSGKEKARSNWSLNPQKGLSSLRKSHSVGKHKWPLSFKNYLQKTGNC